MSNVTPLRPKAAKASDTPHIPTASAAPTTVAKVPNAVQTRMTDDQVGKRQPPEPTSETLALGGGAQTIAVGKGNLRNLQRGDVLEVVVHCTVVEAGGVRDKLDTKSGAVKDSVAKVVANIDRFDEVKVIGQVDVDAVADDHPGDAPAADDVTGERVPCHRCDGKGSFHAPGEDPDPCGLCKGTGSIPKGDDEVVDPADTIVEQPDSESLFDGVDAGGPTPPQDPLPEPPTGGLVVGDRSTYTTANLTAKSVRKDDLLSVWQELTGRELPKSVTKAKALDAIQQVLLAAQGEAALDEASADGAALESEAAVDAEPSTPESGTGDIDPNGDVIDEADVAPATSVPTIPVSDTVSQAEPDEYVTGKVADIADDGSDVFAELDASGARVFVHARSGQAFDTIDAAVKFDPKAAVEVEGSDPAPAPQVDPAPAADGDGSAMSFDEASMLTATDLAQRSDEALVDVAVALGVDRSQAASLNRPALLAVIEREQVPF